MEVWKTAKTRQPYTLPYEVSNLGRVRRKDNEHVMALTDDNGYQRLRLQTVEGKRVQYYVHVLVLYTFRPVEYKLKVNHRNHVRNDNRLENLEWVTHSKNVKLSYQQNSRRKSCARMVWMLSDEEMIRFESIKAATEHTGIRGDSISAVCKGKRKSAGGHIWVYDRRLEKDDTYIPPSAVKMVDLPYYITKEGDIYNLRGHKRKSYTQNGQKIVNLCANRQVKTRTVKSLVKQYVDPLDI